VLQGLLIVVLLITIGINIMFILDTSRRLHDEVQTAGETMQWGSTELPSRVHIHEARYTQRSSRLTLIVLPSVELAVALS
jgi:hypothetical protein